MTADEQPQPTGPIPRSQIPTQPTASQLRAINEISRILNRSNPDLKTIDILLNRAVGGNIACLEPLRAALTKPNLPASTRLPIFLKALPLAETAIQRVYGTTYRQNPAIHGHFWRLTESQGYIRLLLELVTVANDAKDYKVALSTAQTILEANHGDNNGIRDRIPLFLLHLNRPLEALNFCLSWLDTAHDGYDSLRYCPKGGFGDLKRYKKTDFDPTKPLQTAKVQNLGHASLIFSAALSAYRVFGDCTLSKSWLREAHNANSHVIPILVLPSSDWPKKTNQNPRGLGSEPEARDYVFFAGDLWEGEPRQWVVDVAKEVERRECARRECRKVEPEKGRYKMCGGCHATWYCGQECQVADWKLGGHKRRCKEEKNIREITASLSRRVWGLRSSVGSSLRVIACAAERMWTAKLD
ncbi:hypothetical protein EX30DRAFT_364003 [Ascodesmis nigricans]|uniref:MYND-type domain-containing protein n=1 Tax=Ascodesmis nigricans TaxID=341454 RepID=A0A4S2MXL0_9PEZI|nr:hypothetical protein EX30DRAFT_364003 [Ascodesmis nigricans]